jgi:hypothetical protein
MALNNRMRLTEISFRPRPQVAAMSDAERHQLLEFIYNWLSGSFMQKPSPNALVRWQTVARLFPPKVSGEMSLFRLVTVSSTFAAQRRFTFKPAPGVVSSWTSTLVGLDAVAGVATDLLHNYGSAVDRTETARLGIEATIPGDLIFATPTTIRNAVMALSHDYFERYREVVRKDHTVTHPGYPGGEDASFHMDDVGFLQDVLNRPGGHYRQYEYVVRTPPQVDATVVQIYRIGDKIVRQGNDDPHQFPKGVRPPRVSRLR